MKEILEGLLSGKSLTKDMAKKICIAMGRNELEAPASSAILVALRCKGEEYEEIAGFAEGLREMALRVGPYPDAIDTAGTGGDRAGLMNVSTASAIVLAEVSKVVKHGNRSVSSVSGSADVLEGVGYNIYLEPHKVERAIEESNFAFLFAPLYHPAMKNIMPVRKLLGIRTIFNLIGPLSNPARPGYQVLGVASEDLLEKIARALHTLGVKRAIVVHGEPGIDEVSPVGKTKAIEIEGEEIHKITIEPPIKLSELEKLKVNSKEEAVQKFVKSLKGEFYEGKVFVALNAGVGISLIKGIEIEDGFKEAMEIIESGAAFERLKKAVQASGGQLKFQ